MAKQEQLDFLEQGIETWNIWREQHQEVSIDLSDFHFTNVNMRGANLREAKFSGSKLFFGDLREADLREARFAFATLRYADFSMADLSRADFGIVDLIETTFLNTKLVGTNLGGAKLNNANLRESDLREADLRGADLSGADLSGAIVGWTIFGNLDLRMVKGLEMVQHVGSSTIGTDTLSRSHGEIPEVFLRGAGLDEIFISSAHTLAKKTIRYDSYFISYARQDQIFAEQLYASLQRQGIRCWFLPEEMDADYKTRDIFDAMICYNDKLLLVLSEHSLAHYWIEHEVEQTLYKESEQQSIVLYPVCVDKAILTCGEVWAKKIRESRHINDFEGWTDRQQYEESLKLLLSELVRYREKIDEV